MNHKNYGKLRIKDENMKYTLSDNAISSLSIAIDNFKKFYYFNDKYSQSECHEAMKICIVFLENAIELMLKDILVSNDPLSIYEHPNSREIKRALGLVTDTCKLEDILISKGNFKTITYTKTIQEYNKKFHNSDKVYNILNDLGKKRNAITHFGIDETTDEDELIITIINVFDVIYNYLYPQLIKLNKIKKYFVSDDFMVDTVHGKKLLFDMDTFVYNNIVDFLDELMETSKNVIMEMRVNNPKSKICEFTTLMDSLISDEKYKKMLVSNCAQINYSTCDIQHNDFYFEASKNSEFLDSIFSFYSPFFNVTGFCGECGKIYFLIVHDIHKLYIYNKNSYVPWPQHDEPEQDKQWITDMQNGMCQEYNLSKKNLLLAFKNIFK